LNTRSTSRFSARITPIRPLADATGQGEAVSSASGLETMLQCE
jgi:hypothetical protein